MARYAVKGNAAVDVLVVGDHASAYLAAVLLKQKTSLRVVHASLPVRGDADRLVILNPELLGLHPVLGGLRESLSMVAVYGLDFLSDQADTRSQHRAKRAMTHVCRYEDVRGHMVKLAKDHQVETLDAEGITIHRVDEEGLDVSLGKHRLKPTAMVLACDIPADQKKMLGIPDSWGQQAVHRFTVLRCKSARHLNADGKPLMPMSLDLLGKLCWGWLLPGDGEFQIAVEEPVEQATDVSGNEMLLHWAGVLQQHGVLGPKFQASLASVYSIELPLAGALEQEGVANRTLLIGPAGGFYSACGEEIYPCCWSALFAVEVMKKAIREKHLQDALNSYRQRWRTTLGDYLRGPQQNLRFLLPLVYRNPAMTARLAEAILLSKSVVR